VAWAELADRGDGLSILIPRCTCGHDVFGHVLDPDMTAGPCEQNSHSGRKCGCVGYTELAESPEFTFDPDRAAALDWRAW
jgi:hypothetical protein